MIKKWVWPFHLKIAAWVLFTISFLLPSAYASQSPEIRPLFGFECALYSIIMVTEMGDANNFFISIYFPLMGLYNFIFILALLTSKKIFRMLLLFSIIHIISGLYFFGSGPTYTLHIGYYVWMASFILAYFYLNYDRIQKMPLKVISKFKDKWLWLKNNMRMKNFIPFFVFAIFFF